MSGHYTLGSPFMEIKIEGPIRRRKLALIVGVWSLFWLAVSIAVLYLYAVVFPRYVGFEIAVLVGIGILALRTGD